MNISQEELTEISKTALSYSDILRSFGYVRSGANTSKLKKLLNEYGIMFTTRNGAKFHGIRKSQVPIEDILANKVPYESKHLKVRLIKSGILEAKCSNCGCGDSWFGKPLTLQLDYINGNHEDNSLENLRLLCPNCHSQTPTWGMRNKLKVVKVCLKCGNSLPRTNKSGLCKPCGQYKKVETRPPKEELLELINKRGFEATGRQFGVSGNAVRKWIKT